MMLFEMPFFYQYKENVYYKNPQNLAQQVSVRNIVETDHILLITYAYQNMFHYLLVNKSDGSCSNVQNELPGFVEDLKQGPDFAPY